MRELHLKTHDFEVVGGFGVTAESQDFMRIHMILKWSADSESQKSHRSHGRVTGVTWGVTGLCVKTNDFEAVGGFRVTEESQESKRSRVAGL